MLNTKNNNELAVDCFLLAGRIMMECGAETYRVEDTMLRMARSQNIEDAQSYATPTGIIFSLGRQDTTRISSISSRTTDLHKITLVNNVSRKLTSHIITLEEAYDELKKIQNKNYFLPVWIQVLAASFASAGLLILFFGQWTNAPIAFVAGGLGHYIVIVTQNITKVKFFSEFVATIAVGLTAVTGVHFGFGDDINVIIIGSIMPLVPGLPMTNAVRDLMAGHFTAGIAKGTEALLTAFAIGAGIAAVFAF